MNERVPGPELTDEDVYDAMGRLPGYLDITTEDFRALYRLAFGHALERLVGGLRARDLMRPTSEALRPDLTLEGAARLMAARGLKSSPVTDAAGLVTGVLSETDVLRRLGAATFLELLTQPPGLRAQREAMMRSASVGEVMTRPAVTVAQGADYRTILGAFRSHGGRRMPVVDDAGRLVGMLARKDFLAACPLGPGDGDALPAGPTSG
jgi:CBS-domain-containing membrane protein